MHLVRQDMEAKNAEKGILLGVFKFPCSQGPSDLDRLPDRWGILVDPCPFLPEGPHEFHDPFRIRLCDPCAAFDNRHLGFLVEASYINGHQAIPEGVLRTATRIVGVLLAAIAVDFIVTGIQDV